MGTAYLKTLASDVDKTCFMGAIRYLYDELHLLFPKAKIYVVTPSGLSYGNGGNLSYLDKGTQIKYASSLLSIPIIDWGMNGRINYLGNNVTGSGTQADPYIITNAGEYSIDSMHPNDDGALLLAKEIAAVLNQY